MITKSTHCIGRVLRLCMVLVLAGFLSFGEHGKAMAGEAGHGDHAATRSSDRITDPHGGHDGGQIESRLMVTTDPAAVKPGEPVKLNLMIQDATGAVIKDFETVHEKKLHLIIVSDRLARFAHIHPEIDSAGNITGAYTFPTAGMYRLYADHKPAGGKQTVSTAEVNVAGTPPPMTAHVPDAPGRVKGDELEADIVVENGKAGGTTRISFTLFDAAGRPVSDLQPYLGAMGHLVILSGDGRQYVHSHPLEGRSTGGGLAFEAHFAHPGIYKGWAEFRRSDAIHEVSFVVQID